MAPTNGRKSAQGCARQPCEAAWSGATRRCGAEGETRGCASCAGSEPELALWAWAAFSGRKAVNCMDNFLRRLTKLAGQGEARHWRTEYQQLDFSSAE